MEALEKEKNEKVESAECIEKVCLNLTQGFWDDAMTLLR